MRISLSRQPAGPEELTMEDTATRAHVAMAIERRTVIAAAPNVYPDKIVLRSEATGETVSVDLSKVLRPDGKGRWANYPKGV